MNRDVDRKVGGNIRQYRRREKMTQNELARMLQLMGCDLTRSTLAKIEVGQRHLYLDELITIKEVLQVSYENLLEL